MVKIIIIILVIVLILTLIMFLLLKKIVSNINEQSKIFFMMKLQSYDELIEQKEKELKEIKREVIEKQETAKNEYREKVNVVIQDNIPKYKVEGLLETVKKVNSEFNYDMVKIINTFIEKASNCNNANYYIKLLVIKEVINKFDLFNIVIKDEYEQLEIIKKLSIDDERLMKIYNFNYKSFDINNFLKILDNEIEKNDPIIYVYVGNEKENYDYLGKNIKTCIDNTILKGVKIKYHNVIYEYCLSY